MKLGICTGRLYPNKHPVYGECSMFIPNVIPSKIIDVIRKRNIKKCNKCSGCSIYQKGRCFYGTQNTTLSDVEDELIFGSQFH